MILSSASHFTHRCPLAPLNAVRWTVGVIASVLWFRVGFADLVHDEMTWNLLAAVISTQVFGTICAGILMLRPRTGLLRRVTDWHAIVTSVMTWVLGVAAVLSNGVEWLQIALLLCSLMIGVAWIAMIYFGLRPIHLDAIGRQ
jgi:hypothetical protein